MKNTLSLFLLFTLIFVDKSIGQEDTFIRTYDFEGEYVFGGGLQADLKDENIIISNIWFPISGETSSIQVMTLSNSGEVLKVNNSGLDFGLLPPFSFARNFTDEADNAYMLLSERPFLGIWKTNSDNELLWQHSFVPPVAGSFIRFDVSGALSENEDLTFALNGGSRLFIGIINSEGELIEYKRIIVNRPSAIQYEYDPAYTYIYDERIFTIGLTSNKLLLNNGSVFGSGFLIETNQELNVLNFFDFNNFTPLDMDRFANGDILFTGTTSGYSDFERNLVLIRFTSEMEFIKGIELPGFSSLVNVEGIISDNQDVYCRFSGGTGNGGNVIFKLNENLELDWAKNFENTNFPATRTLQMTTDDKLLFAGVSKDFPKKIVLYKMTQEGEIDGYSFHEFCINEIIPFTPEITSYTTTDVFFENAFDATFISPDVNTFLVDNCLIVPELPLPNFNLPSRICADNCTAPTGLLNETADSVKWQFENAIPAISTEKIPGQVCFTEAGTHIVSQAVYYNNCEEYYETSIEVISDLEVDLVEDQIICNGESISINANTDNADAYDWNTGEISPILTISEPGTYIVTVSNELCTDEDTIIISEIIPEPYPISLAEDTVICRQNLPFILNPIYAVGEDISWQDGTNSSDLVVNEEGLYIATLSLDGCTYSAEILVEIEDCSSKVFIPNVFSPNNDGVNDMFRAEGINFETKQMRIYGRWGTLIYDSNSADAAWDGRYQGDFMDQNIFVYVISYRNILLGTEETVSGDVLILR